MTSVKQAWTRIRAWYERIVKEPPYPDFFDWGQPASEDEIEILESTLGITIPSGLRETYSIHNGDNQQRVLPGGYLMDIAEVMMTWKMFEEPVKAGIFDNGNPKPQGPIKRNWWNLNWIPVLHNGGGDYHCLDMDPADGGTVGQFISFEHETGPSHVVSPSFDEFLFSFADDLERDRFEFDLLDGAIRR